MMRSRPKLRRLPATFVAGFGSLLFVAGVFAQQNLALHQPVASSGANWGSFKPAALTDGDPATFTHPAAASGTADFYYEVDLGADRRLERIVLRNRQDGCCTERLSRIRVEVWSDAGGGAGRKAWSALVRGDGSDSGVGGTDTLLAELDPVGDFAGRFVRVVNTSGAPYNPQLAEIEVYGGSAPRILRFTTSEDALRSGETATLSWEIAGASAAFLEPEPGPVNPVSGSVVVGPSVSTVYTLVATNANGVVRATARIGVNPTLAPPRLSEFVADNDAQGPGGWEDDDGDASDWIELFNPNEYSLRLAGYALSDAPSAGRKWVFPDVRIPPLGYLVVFASGKDRRDPARALHTDFRLAAEGEVVALIDRDGVSVSSSFPGPGTDTARYPAQRPGASFGVGAGGTVGFLRPPTPGAANGAAFAGLVGNVVWSHDRGLYDETEIRVTLSTDTPGATIRYTTDRSLPKANQGRIYSEPIVVTNTTVLRVAAFRDGWAETPVETRTFVFPARVIAASAMRRSITTNAVYRPLLPAALREIPTVCLAATGTINDTTEVPGAIEWIPATGTNVSTTGPSQTRGAPCAVRWFGGAFTDFAKKNFRLYFRPEYGARRFRAPLFEESSPGIEAVESFEQLELRGGSHDMEMRGFYLANAFTDDTLLEMGHLNPHGRFVHLVLNGTYWGVYHLRERWGASMHRSYRGGTEEDYESINGNWNVGGWPDPGVPYDGDGAAWTRVKSLRSDYPAIREWVDVPEYVDFMLMWLFGGAEDEYRCVGTRQPGAGFQFYLNDADGWFCGANYCAAGDRTARGSPGRQPGDGPGSLFSMLFASGDAEYRTLLGDRIAKAFGPGGALSVERNQARLARRAAEFERPFLLESARWGYLTPTEWASRRDYVRQRWLPRRTAEALAQFRTARLLPTVEAPELVPIEEEVVPGTNAAFRSPGGGTIYFTFDGSDPRLPGGGVSPTASSVRPSTATGETLQWIPAGSRWRWHTDAVGLGSSAIVPGHPQWNAAHWKHPDFVDSGWSEGPAELGYGEGDEATVVPFGSADAKWTTLYLRRRVVVDLPSTVTTTSLRLKCDDGAIVYLNGIEVARHSMPEGAVDGVTAASSSPDDGRGFTAFDVPATRWRAGTNWVAVEVHQASPTTSDASFDLEWVASTPPGPPVPAFRVDARTFVRARTLRDGQWSPLVERFYRVGPDGVAPGDVVIREIAYHPRGVDDAEFVEIENVASHAVDLAGSRFVDGMGFRFPSFPTFALAPGERRVLVNDVVRFRRQYGGAIPVAGIFSGRLDNAGERLRWLDAAGRTLVDLRYGVGGAWPSDTSGGGYTLVLVRPDRDPDDPSSWRPSVSAGGSPGASDGVVFVGDPEADADGDGWRAIVEYAMGTDPADARSGRDGVEVTADPGGWLVVRVARNPGADDVDLAVEASTDLRTWVGLERRAIERGAEGGRKDRWEMPVGEARSAFLRISVVRR